MEGLGFQTKIPDLHRGSEILDVGESEVRELAV